MADSGFLTKDGDMTLSSLGEAVNKEYSTGSNANSLFSYTRRAVINSRVFIEKSIAGDEILTPLMQNIYTLYTGLILTALNLNHNIDGTHKVADELSIVSTEGFNVLADGPAPVMSSDLISRAFGSPKMAMPAQNKTYSDKAQDVSVTQDNSTNIKYDPKDANKVLDLEPKNVSLPSARTIQATMHTDKGVPFSVNMILMLTPTFVPSETASQFVLLNFTAGWFKRLTQARMGEISFFKDFLLGCDQRAKRAKALLNDKSNVLHDMVAKQRNNLHREWAKRARPGSNMNNIANTILIFEKSNFMRACSSTGLRFENASYRQRFFEKSYAMMLVLVDPMFNQIDMYYNGLNAVSTFTYDQVRREAKKEGSDITQIMKTYAQGLAPKF